MMSDLTEKAVEFCIDAYNVLIEDESKNACYIKYREGDNKGIEYLMQKHSYYFGIWVLFDGAHKAFSVSEDLLKKWSEQRESERKRRAEQFEKTQGETK